MHKYKLASYMVYVLREAFVLRVNSIHLNRSWFQHTNFPCR